jgi:hypothetical protein
MTTEELRRLSLLQYAELRRKAVIDAQQDTPITITPNAAAGSSGGGSTPPPPPPPGSPLTILQYIADLGPTVVWSDDNATTFTLDPTLLPQPPYSYTLDTSFIPQGPPPTPSAFIGVTIGNTVTDIGVSAFSNCFLLASVTFSPTSVLTTINDLAFSDSPSLTTIEIPTSVTSIASDAFLNSGLTTVTIANGQLGITSPSASQAFFGATVNTVLP